MNLKKILAAGLSLAMLASLSVCAFADEEEEDTSSSTTKETITEVTEDLDEDETLENSVSADVNGSKTVESIYDGPTYSVTVEWTSADLVYTETGTYTWDTGELKYVESSTKTSTEGGSITITVTNYSDAAVNAAVSYADVENDNITASVSFDTSSADIETAAQSGGSAITYTNTNTTGTAVSQKFTGTVSISEGASNLGTSSQTIATVTVTITSSEIATYTTTTTESSEESDTEE